VSQGPESSGAGGLLIEGAASIATLAGGLRRGRSQADAAVIDGGGLSVAVWNGEILAVGREGDVSEAIARAGLDRVDFDRLDARGGLVTPGLVDAHTHLVFAGTREAEWQMRLHGASYLDVLAAGGGILSTVAATRAATPGALEDAARARLAQMLAAGTTTAEAKSGYGLDAESELRILGVIGRLADEGPVELVPTFLGAHAVQAEFRSRIDVADATDAYVASVIGDQLPKVAEQGIARFCDVFCEAGVFSAAQTASILQAADRKSTRLNSSHP
jgi:imidazolonepropionase